METKSNLRFMQLKEELVLLTDFLYFSIDFKEIIKMCNKIRFVSPTYFYEALGNNKKYTEKASCLFHIFIRF